MSIIIMFWKNVHYLFITASIWIAGADLYSIRGFCSEYSCIFVAPKTQRNDPIMET